MAAFHYEYRTPGLQKSPIEVVNRVLTELTESPEGLTDKTLLEASRDKNAPLHCEFEWNNGKAAEQYRLIQAQRIIRNVYIVYTTEDEERDERRERAYVSVPGGKTAYVTLKSAMTNDEWKKHLLEDARQDAERFLAKYRRLQELADVNNAISAFLYDVG